MEIHLIGIRGSPGHLSVRNIEVKFIRIYSPGPRFSVRCPYYRGFFQIKHMRILSGPWKLSVTERCPYLGVKKKAILFNLFWYKVFVH